MRVTAPAGYRRVSMSWFKRDKPEGDKLPKIKDAERRVNVIEFDNGAFQFAL